MRNIDIAGGLHDFDMPALFFPWSVKEFRSGEGAGTQFTSSEIMKAHDLFYLAEAVHWFDLLLHGRNDAVLGNTPYQVVKPNQFNEILLLHEENIDSPFVGIQRLLPAMETGVVAIENPFDFQALLGDHCMQRYFKGWKLGDQIGPDLSQI